MREEQGRAVHGGVSAHLHTVPCFEWVLRVDMVLSSVPIPAGNTSSTDRCLRGGSEQVRGRSSRPLVIFTCGQAYSARAAS